VIYIIDHLNSEGNETMSIESNQTDGNLNNDCEIISFPSEEVEEVSKEEIGKWVDQLMDMPEPENSFSDILDNFSIEHEDPFIRVAERILSEETS
jgi:hypothetical protein